MNKKIYFLAIFALMSACIGCKQKTDKNGNTETTMEKRTDISYMQYPLAYLIEGVLYFHDFENSEKVKFIEEPDPILNFVFNAEGKTLYYSVERDNTLWLKSAEISNSEIIPQWLMSWNLNIEDDFSFVGMNPLYYHEGKIVIMHGYHDDSQSYGRMTYITSTREN